MADFETMPIGTAQLLRDLANQLRIDHAASALRYAEADEKARQATGWQRDAFSDDMTTAERRADHLAEQIGRIEALLDRCPHAPPLETEISASPMSETEMIGPD